MSKRLSRWRTNARRRWAQAMFWREQMRLWDPDTGKGAIDVRDFAVFEVPVDRTLHTRIDRAYIIGTITATGETVTFPLADCHLEGGVVTWKPPVTFTPDRVEFHNHERNVRVGVIDVNNKQSVPAGWEYRLEATTHGFRWT